MSDLEREILAILGDKVALEDVQVASEALAPPTDVQKALTSLEGRGFVQHRTGADGHQRYFVVSEARGHLASVKGKR